MKIDAVQDGYLVRLASPGVNNYNMRITVPTLEDVHVILAHHFGHAFTPECTLCVKHARVGPSGQNKLPVERQLPLAAIPALVTKAWRERKAQDAAAYQRQYYLNVTKPKRDAKRRPSPLLMHRPRLTVRLG